MLTLAIEHTNPSSQRDDAAVVALGEADTSSLNILAAEPLRGENLIQAIDRCLTTAKTERRDLERIAVSTGPGGYTAMRIACVTAATIAETLKIDLTPVPTALALSRSVLTAEATLRVHAALVAMAWKRGTAWHATIQRDSFHTLPTDAGVAPITAIADKLSSLAQHHPPALIADDRIVEQLTSNTPLPANVAAHAPAYDAREVLALAPHLPTIDPAAIRPLYPREPEAVSNWRQLHGIAPPTR